MNENLDSKPMTKTSAVPIRKETVRVTLKAPQPGAGPTAPPAPMAPAPMAPAPMAPPAPAGAPKPPVPTAGAPKPPAPAPTIPLRSAGSPTGAPPAPAPTVKLNTGPGSGPATKLATPAPTVRLNTPTSGPGTVPLATGGAPSQPLPSATVQLTQTQPMETPAAPSQAATIHTADDDSTSEESEGLVTALSAVSLVAALIVLGVQLATANIWIDGKWGSLLGL